MDKCLKNIPINTQELEDLIKKNSEKLICDYFKNKTLLFLQKVSNEHELDYNDLVNKYIVEFDAKNENELFTYSELTCRGLTKTGAKCTHKCNNGSFFCKKHQKLIKHSSGINIIKSYFPS